MEHRVKHLRLFGCRLNSDSIAVNWLLRHAGHHDCVEYIEVNVINSAQIPASFSSRNHFATVPFLEITFDHTSTFPHGTTKVSDLAPWTDESPCTTQTADGKTIAEPNDRVLCLVEAGALCAFFAEHFSIADVWNPRSAFQRCRVNEACAHTELLARRLFSMVLVMLFAKTAGTSDEDAVTGIAAHERELLWSFRIMEDMLTRSEEAAAHAAGFDYQELLAIGEREVEEQEAEAEKERSMTTPAEVGGGATGTLPSEDVTRTAEKVGETSAQDPTTEKGQRHSVIRPPTSPTLVALDAFIVGRSMSIADFVVTSDLLVFPYLQSWLPSSLKHTRFPAILRYLERMRTVEGAVDALRPRLSFMKIFRRRPKIMASNPTMNAHAERLRKLVDRIAADRAKQDHAKNGDHDGASAEKKCEKQSENEKLSEQQSKPPEKRTSFPTGSTSPKSLVTVAPEAAQELHNNGNSADFLSTLSTNVAVAHPETVSANDTTPKTRETPQAFEGGRVTQWAPCLIPATPLLPPSTCTLVAEDEVALRRSERAVSVVKRAGRTRDDRSSKPKAKKEKAAKKEQATAATSASLPATLSTCSCTTARVEGAPTTADTTTAVGTTARQTAPLSVPFRSATALPQSRRAQSTVQTQHLELSRVGAVRSHSLHQPSKSTAQHEGSSHQRTMWSHDPYCTDQYLQAACLEDAAVVETRVLSAVEPGHIVTGGRREADADGSEPRGVARAIVERGGGCASAGHNPRHQDPVNSFLELVKVKGTTRVRSMPANACRPRPQRGPSAPASTSTPTSSPAAPVMAPLPASSFICSSVPQSLAIDHFFSRDPRNNPCGRIPM